MNSPIRTFHRWTSMTFVAGFVTYMVAMIGGPPPAWVGLLALVPLLLLMCSGIYMFVRPFFMKSGEEGREGERA